MSAPTATGQLLTAEEFFRLPDPPDGSRQELVRGKVLTMPPPGARHGACCSQMIYLLKAFVTPGRLGTVFGNDTGFVAERAPDTVRGPDVSFWSKDRLREIPAGYVQSAPDLAVEVISPDDHFTHIQTISSTT